MRKLLTLLLAAVMLLSIAPLALAEAVPVKWVSLGNGMPENVDTWKAKVDEYLMEKIGVTLDIDILSWGAYGDRRNAIINGGEYFDVVFTDGGSYPADIQKGVLLDIKPLLDTVPALKALIPEGMWEAITIDGKIYAVPTLKDSALAHYFVFNPLVMEEHGIDVSGAKDFATLDPVLRKMKEAGIEAPFTMNKGGAYHMLDVYDGAGLGFPAVGVRYDDAERKVVSVFETEDIMANLKQLHTWYKDGIINQDAFTLAETPSELPFFVAQGWPGAWPYTTTNDAGEETKVIGITNPFIGPIFSAGSIMGSMNGVYAGAKNPEKVLQFLELVNTDTKLRDMICYGEEGVNFTYNEDGLVVKDAEKAWPWARYTQGNHAVLTAENTNPGMFKEIEVVNETATPTVLFGFNLDMKDIENEVTLVKGVYEDFASELLTGAEDPEVLVPKMIEAMKAVGLDKIMEEFQKQVDEYFAK